MTAFQKTKCFLYLYKTCKAHAPLNDESKIHILDGANADLVKIKVSGKLLSKEK